MFYQSLRFGTNSLSVHQTSLQEDNEQDVQFHDLGAQAWQRADDVRGALTKERTKKSISLESRLYSGTTSQIDVEYFLYLLSRPSEHCHIALTKACVYAKISPDYHLKETGKSRTPSSFRNLA